MAERVERTLDVERVVKGAQYVYRYVDVGDLVVLVHPVLVEERVRLYHTRNVLHLVLTGYRPLVLLRKGVVHREAPAPEELPVDVGEALPRREGLEGRVRLLGGIVYLRLC